MLITTTGPDRLFIDRAFCCTTEIMNKRSFVAVLSINGKQPFKHDCGSSRLSLDIDECRDSMDACDANANCQNTWGSFSCSCKAGFIGDGKSCSG